MTKCISFILIVFLSFFSQDLFSQFKLDFGNLTKEQLSNKPYLPDPGADAIVISDIGVATLNYGNGFYVELERDVRIRIVNSNGFDYADIEIPFSINDNLSKYRASSFNLRNGEKVETVIPKKSFIIEESTRYRKSLKFNFPDVHEGTVIEYSYIIQMRGESIASLVPWIFQSSIPIEYSSLILGYPDFFTYKTIISGNPLLIKMEMTNRNQYIAGQYAKVLLYSWSAQNVPALKDEPFIKSLRDNQTRLSFELESVKFPNSKIEEISPTYTTLTKKLLERNDFGLAIKNAAFLKETAEKVTKGLKDDLSKVKAVHKYISEKILWNGDEDFTSSSGLRKVVNEEKGNNADINMILIAMLRSINIKADPVILCTRSNGTLSQFSAMVQQFNYLVAYVNAGGENILVDATNPLSPFDMLPFDCLNGSGRLINEYESKFVDLKNAEKSCTNLKLDLSLDTEGVLAGVFIRRNKGYSALDIREMVKLEGEEGYGEIVRDGFSQAEIADFVVKNISLRDSDITETCKINIDEGILRVGNKLLLNPYLSFISTDNPFISPERSFTVDFGCPIEQGFSLSIQIPDNYEIEEMPDNVTYLLGTKDAKYVFTCSETGNRLVISSTLSIDKTAYLPDEYSMLRDFFVKMLQSQARLIVLKKKI